MGWGDSKVAGLGAEWGGLGLVRWCGVGCGVLGWDGAVVVSRLGHSLGYDWATIRIEHRVGIGVKAQGPCAGI